MSKRIQSANLSDTSSIEWSLQKPYWLLDAAGRKWIDGKLSPMQSTHWKPIRVSGNYDIFSDRFFPLSTEVNVVCFIDIWYGTLFFNPQQEYNSEFNFVFRFLFRMSLMVDQVWLRSDLRSMWLPSSGIIHVALFKRNIKDWKMFFCGIDPDIFRLIVWLFWITE